MESSSATASTSPPRPSARASGPHSLSAPNPASAQATLALGLPELTESYPNLRGLTGRSPVMRQLIQQMQRMAPHLTLATLEGEEGTGRTLAARALHAAGPASDGPFVPCLATHFFSPGPVTEEIDGHGVRRAPILRQAHSGTLFLDRVHQLSAEQQERLAEFLRWFDDHQFHAKSNSTAAGAADQHDAFDGFLPTQILFSTSVPLRNSSSGFREDLASRLCAVRFRLPPLTERREDIPLLAQIFIQRFAHANGKAVRGLGPGTIAPLLRYAWPGNVRELEETIAAAAQETESHWIRPIDLPPLSTGNRDRLPGNGGPETASDSDCNLDAAIRNHVDRVLHRTRGNKLRAAQLLGISRSTLYRILAAQPGEDSAEG